MYEVAYYQLCSAVIMKCSSLLQNRMIIFLFGSQEMSVHFSEINIFFLFKMSINIFFFFSPEVQFSVVLAFWKCTNPLLVKVLVHSNHSLVSFDVGFIYLFSFWLLSGLCAVPSTSYWIMLFPGTCRQWLMKLFSNMLILIR